ncbi:unnamed protein product [Chrysoparadoxa australica]
MEDDTLTGICLRYKVSKKELHKFNDFFGDHFRLCTTLRIPVGSPSTLHKQEPTEPVLMQQFINASGVGAQEAKFYLGANEWDLQAALDEYKADVAWEKEEALVLQPGGELATAQQPEESSIMPSAQESAGASRAAARGLRRRQRRVDATGAIELCERQDLRRPLL